jgi:uncharacterized protein (DUF362 family)
MRRRSFLQAIPVVPAAGGLASAVGGEPHYRVVTPFRAEGKAGMPGAFPGRVVSVHSPASFDPQTDQANPEAVRAMLDRAMTALTGEPKAADAWRRFFEPSDVVGIKVNCSGAPQIMSHPAVVAEVVRNLIAVGVKSQNIFVWERFPGQLDSVNYPAWLPEGVNVLAVEKSRDSIRAYDPRVYVEVNFFGEDDTRSHLVRLATQRFTKIINVPNMKDHGASGVTGCLKNIAYGSFQNVARSHQHTRTNTLTFIGTLAAVEPLRSRTVLHVMDGLKGVWHGGPFAPEPRFRFYPRKILAGTDPVAMDRVLLEAIEAKRKQEGAISVWDRSEKSLELGRRRGAGFRHDPNANNYLREPGHIEYAAGLGLGVYDLAKIRHQEFEIA